MYFSGKFIKRTEDERCETMHRPAADAAGSADRMQARKPPQRGCQNRQTDRSDRMRRGKKHQFSGQTEGIVRGEPRFPYQRADCGDSVTVGQQIRKGETVARMDSRDYALQLAATEAEYKQVKAEAERVIRLYEKQSVSENDYDKAVSGLQQITAKYNAHRNALADTRLTAPFDGYVQKIHYDAGETVAAGMPVVSLISSSAPEVEINIPASEFIRSDEFETYRCSSEIYPDREFPLELVSISRKANLNQLYTARLRFLPTGPDTPLTPGMSVMVTIGLRSGTTGAVKIPLSAMLEHDGTPAVWVYNPADSTVALRKIRPSAISRDGILTVTGGLHAGEQVVSAGVHALKENDKVKPLPAATSTNVGGLL